MPTHEEHASQTAPEWPKICPKCEKPTHSRYGATYLGDDRMLCGQCFFGLQREQEEQRKEDERQAKLDAENAIRQEEREHVLEMIEEVKKPPISKRFGKEKHLNLQEQCYNQALSEISEKIKSLKTMK